METTRVKFLKIVLGKLEENKRVGFPLGICILIDLLQFDYDRKEVSIFKKWFKSQKPHSNLHSNFTKHTHWLGGDFWWVRTQEGTEQRILFLKHLIERNSK
jgi:hypothetical protein